MTAADQAPATQLHESCDCDADPMLHCHACLEDNADALTDQSASSIDSAHLTRQRDFSLRTFGPGARHLGVIDHILKELDEIAADPTDLGEWVDVIILGFDGAMREGHEPQAIIDAIKAKQARNEARTWPDWRGMDPNKAIEHDRTGEQSEARP